MSTYLYSNQQSPPLDNSEGITEKNKEEINQADGNTKIASQSIKQNKLIVPKMNSARQAPLTDDLSELGNPYSKFAGSIPPISMQEAPEYISTILGNKAQLPAEDKAALEVMSDMYRESESDPKVNLNFNEIKAVASTIDNQEIKQAVIKKIAWSEVKTGKKSFDDFGIHPNARSGEDADLVKLTNKLISLYIKSNEFERASKESDQIKDAYLRSLALNRILNLQLKNNAKKTKAQVLRNKIAVISQDESLSDRQKSLIMGILS